MNALAATHDAAVHLHRAEQGQSMGRSRGGLTSKIHALVDTNGLPIRLALTTGEAHDNRLAEKLLSRLKSEQYCWPTVVMTLTGSEPLPPRGAFGPTSRHDAIAMIRSASARISTVLGI